MNDMISHLLGLKSELKGYWAERILSELQYAVKLSRAGGRAHDALLRTAIESLAAQQAAAGAVTRETVEETESKLQPLAAEAKSFTVLCPSHAHIDMNWMWRFDETVAVTLETFRTMLALMNEYPAFTFSQSQASVYRIVEEYDPDMLKEIRRRVKEGRWEVTASTWVETDKNIPSGESLARHCLYTKRYLSALLDVPADSLLLDFEPDTFGHSRNVPEILARAGVRWYYHNRGYEEHTLFRWQAPSGAQVIVYRDPYWYNAEVSPEMAFAVPELCRRHGMDTMLRVYGVGDHGGGPTRRDIERIIDMDGWPIFPRFRFGTFREFYGLAEKVAEKLPVVNKELNFIFTGCYTTQTRIKAANRMSENRLVEAETFTAIAALVSSSAYRTEHLARAWQTTLFNHFHDIIPGSGTVDTREYALGQAQEVLAAAASEETLALRRLAANVDTSALGNPKEDVRATRSEGAGVGFGVADFNLSYTERGRGITRVFHVFNPLPWTRTAVVEAVVWDWPGDPARAHVTDATGAEVPHQIIPNERTLFFGTEFWGHQYIRLLVRVTVPGCGYATCSLSQAPAHDLPAALPTDPRVERPDSFVLENECVRAAFDPRTAALRSFVDKATGEEMMDQSREGGLFRLIREDDVKGMTAWAVGRYMSVRSIQEEARITPVVTGGLRQWLTFEAGFASSRLKATVSLDVGSAALSWSVECEWLEVGRKGTGVPQLGFHLPLSGEVKHGRYDVPFGSVERPVMDMDVPASSWAVAVPKKQGRKALQLIADQKHGFRLTDNALSLACIRSSYDPDPHPELGIHKFSFGVRLSEVGSTGALAAAAAERAHPLLTLSGTAHAGSLPPSRSFLSLEQGSVAVTAVKMPEDGQGGRLVVRMHETDGKATQAALRLFCAPTGAWLADIIEQRLKADGSVSVAGDTVTVDMQPHAIATLVIQLESGR
jgi:alpha-mannosidase